DLPRTQGLKAGMVDPRRRRLTLRLGGVLGNRCAVEGLLPGCGLLTGVVSSLGRGRWCLPRLSLGGSPLVLLGHLLLGRGLGITGALLPHARHGRLSLSRVQLHTVRRRPSFGRPFLSGQLLPLALLVRFSHLTRPPPPRHKCRPPLGAVRLPQQLPYPPSSQPKAPQSSGSSGAACEASRCPGPALRDLPYGHTRAVVFVLNRAIPP